MDIILGILIGAAGMNFYNQTKMAGKKIRLYVWGLFVFGVCSILLGIDTLFNSYIEHEVQAAWLGFGMFGTIGIVLLISGHRLHLKSIDS